ncbi:MAG: hypothetical protein OXH63_02420, partial [Gemmatimonadetes bacterium]|nr:hypothetical protein [Gemmatimonadota bacterium]
FGFGFRFGFSFGFGFGHENSFLASNNALGWLEKNKDAIVRSCKSAVKQARKRALTSNRRLLLYLRTSIYLAFMPLEMLSGHGH